MKKPKAIWIILDPLDGIHVFKSEKEARATFKRWEKEAGNDIFDSFWDMSKPIKYILEK